MNEITKNHPVNRTPITDNAVKNYCTRGELIDLAKRMEREANLSSLMVAKMHEAAMGKMESPKRGVIEDIEDLKKERDDLQEKVAFLEETKKNEAPE